MKKLNQKGFAPLVVIVIMVIAVAIGGYFVVRSRVTVAPTSSPTISPSQSSTNYACTQEAKLCPDGSYVSRTGPKCEFAPCPTVKITSGISGTVKTGPTCPVQRIDDPSCDDKPYQGEFVVKIFDGVTTSEFTRFTTNSAGVYSIKLPPGDYILESANKVGIMTQPEYVTVRPGEMKVFNFSLDTGIR